VLTAHGAGEICEHAHSVSSQILFEGLQEEDYDGASGSNREHEYDALRHGNGTKKVKVMKRDEYLEVSVLVSLARTVDLGLWEGGYTDKGRGPGGMYEGERERERKRERKCVCCTCVRVFVRALAIHPCLHILLSPCVPPAHLQPVILFLPC